MQKAVQVFATGPAAKPVLLCLSGTGCLDHWIESLSSLSAFVAVTVHDLTSAADLTQSCRPDLLLLGPGLREDVPLDCKDRFPDSMLGWLPMVAIHGQGEGAPVTLHPNLEDVLSPDLAIEKAAIRLRAVLRRERPTALTAHVIWKAIELRHDERRVLVGAGSVHLSAQEFNLLAVLLEEPGRVWSRDELIGLIWGIKAKVSVAALNVTIQKLRRHLAPLLGYDCIEAVRGTGYRLIEPV